MNQFSRAFARSNGLSPHRWLIRRRIDVAKDRVRSASMPLVAIALACGFSDQSHFTRMFASVTGATPGRWRRLQLEAGPKGPGGRRLK